LDGTPPPEREITPIKADAKCSASHSGPVFTRGYVVSEDRGLANVVVTVDEGLEAKAFPIAATKALVDQIGCMYEPYVTAAMAGQEVVFRNSDPFMHNVNAMAKANQGFNFAQSTEGQETTKTFTKRENVKIVCNVHPWMAGYIFVFEHPFFAVTDTNGNFQIPPGLASGQYSLRFTHLKAGDISLPVRIEPGMAAKVECSYTVPQ
jgi:plastocyanin